ncbi:MAG: FixH family protein [Gammaproteobacteria bacterium]|nr:FixH family protein [Gammaproteobacteria bacterium]
MSNNTLINQPAWYKQFWPWFLISFPAIAVIAGIITITLAIKSDDGLVKDDYYKAGLAINQTLESSERAIALNASASIIWDKLTQTITLTLTGDISPLPARLTLQLTHATRAHHDQTVTLYLAPDNKSYTGRIESARSGNWTVILTPENNDWRISGRITLPDQTLWNLDAK